MGQIGGVVELKMRNDAESVAQRIAQHAGAGGGTNERKRLQIELDRAGCRAFADQNVDLVVLERRVEDFFDDRREPMNFVDEQHIIALKIGQHGGQVAGLFEDRPRGLLQVDAHLGGHDMRQRGLAQTGRAEQQQVVERLLAAAGGGDEDVELLADFRLTDIVGQGPRPQRPLKLFFIGRAGFAGQQPVLGKRRRFERVVFDHLANCFSASRMPSETPVSAGSFWVAARASRSE